MPTVAQRLAASRRAQSSFPQRAIGPKLAKDIQAIQDRIASGLAIAISSIRIGITPFNSISLTRNQLQSAINFLKRGTLGKRIDRNLESYIGACVANNFFMQRDSTGAPWKPLADSTVLKKSRKINSLGQDKITAMKSRADRVWGKQKLTGAKPRFMRKISGSTRFFVPLVDTGELAKAVTGSAGGRARSASVNNPAFHIQSKAGRVTVDLAVSNPSVKKKMAIHDRLSSSYAYAGKGHRSRIPGREFFYVNRSDEDLFSQVLLAAAFGDSKTEETKKMLFDVSDLIDSRTKAMMENGGVHEFIDATKSVSRGVQKAMANRKNR